MRKRECKESKSGGAMSAARHGATRAAEAAAGNGVLAGAAPAMANTAAGFPVCALTKWPRRREGQSMLAVL